jgi:POT family proton-dependent oligopeptide transporter
MLVALIIFRVFAVPAMKRYDGEVGLDSTWNSPVVKRNGVGAWLLALAAGGNDRDADCAGRDCD